MSDHTGTTAADDVAAFDQIAERSAALRTQLQRVIVGQAHIVDQLLVALFCQGHTLVVGVPGLAKTLMVRTLARAVDLPFHRIQFTPDLMPSDILGTELIQEDPATGDRHLKFVPGPIFAQLILADEINRTPPRTQAALLEAMAERQVTVAGRTLTLDRPFIVVATQNPIEQEGTYPLPEAQLDRFMFSLWMDYPSVEEEVSIVAQTPRIMSETVDQAFDRPSLLRACELIWRMPVSDHVVRYAVNLARATRPRTDAAAAVAGKYIEWGAGPRAGQTMVHGAKALAAMEGEPTPSTEHIRRIAQAVLRHRIVLNYAATGENITVSHIIADILNDTEEPTYT